MKGSINSATRETGAVRSFVTGVTLSCFLWAQAGTVLADAPQLPAAHAAAGTAINPFARGPAGESAAATPHAAPAPRPSAVGPAPSLAAIEQDLNATLSKMHAALTRHRDLIIKKRGKDGVLHITILGTHEDVDLSAPRARLAAIEQRLEEQDRQAAEAFRQDQQQISSHHLPAVIQQRHDEAQARFDKGREERQRNMDALQHSQDLATLLAQSDALQQQTRAGLPQYSSFDPQHAAFRVPGNNARAPLTTPGALQDLLNPHLKQSALALPLQARREPIDALQLAAIQRAAAHGERYLSASSAIELASAGGLGSLLAISQAGTGGGAYLGTSDEVQFTPAIQALAAQLHNNPVAIYNWVHDNIDFVPSYGSIQGADLTLQSRHGNDCDIASLLIALLRAANIPARYVYGTVQLPAAQAQNWFGGLDTPDAAQSLLSQGGVPNSALTQGGVTAALQIEHAWVEAYVDDAPSRGVKGAGSTTWVPLDPSYKQYSITQGLELAQGVNANSYSLDRTLAGSASVNAQSGAISGLNSSAILSALTSYQNQINQFISNHDANATVAEVLGTRSIVPSPADVLPSGLPYHVISAGAPLDTLPDTLRYKLQLALYANPGDTTGLVSYSSSLPALGGQRLTLSFIPASTADQAALDSYFPQPHADGSPIAASEYPATVPGYLIHVIPQILVNGTAVSTAASSAAVELGTALSLSSGLYDPSAQAWDNTPLAPVSAGEYEALVVDGAGVGASQLNNVAQRLKVVQAALQNKQYASLTQDSISGDLLYNTALGYFALDDAFASLYQRAMGVAAARLPSYARAVAEVSPQFQNGVPVKVAFPGVALRVDRYTGSAVAAISSGSSAAGAPATAVDYQRQSLDRASAYAHQVLEDLYGASAQNMPGASAIRALTQSISNAQTVYLLNQNNVANSLPLVSVPAQTASDIQNATAAGLAAVVSQNPVTLGVWQGSGYILSDPATGAGSYLVTGGDTGLLYSAQGMPWLNLARPNQMPADAIGTALAATLAFDAAQAGLLGGVDSMRWSDLPDGRELVSGLYGSSFDFLGGVPDPLLWATDAQIVEMGSNGSSNLSQGSYPPVFTSAPVTRGYAGRAYRYQATAADPAGKPLHFSVAQSPGGVSISATGLVSWDQPVQGAWGITIKVDDGTSSASQAYTLNIAPAPAPLTATLAITPAVAQPGAPVTINFTTTGGSGTVHTALLVNNQAVTLPANGQLQMAAPSAPGVYAVSATASDDVSSLNRSGQILVADSNDTTAPTAQITTPAQDNEVTAPTAVVGTATDNETLANYQLAYRPSGTSNWTVFYTGTQAVSNGTLGTFDPSSLQNGPYDIGLFATDESGNTANSVVGVTVTHNLKIGQFSISFIDLSVDALGIPIKVTRTYDTRRKSQALDFGYGWSVDYQSLVLRKNIATGLNWSVSTSGAQYCVLPAGAHNVVVTLPDGSLQRFTAANATACASYQSPPLSVVFNPLPGTTSTLAATDNPELVMQGGTLYDSTGEAWNPTDFQLTTEDGYVYTLKEGYGIVSVKSPFGQVLQYGASGILHSSDGSTVDESVPFTRDASNRITAITDPAGKKIQYQYDGNGNLSQVTDRAGGLSKFTYNSDHGLASYTDPRGVTMTQNIYDDSGKLIAVIDASGHRTDIATDLSSNTQTVTDRRGNSTTYTFDADGNVTAMTDALGHTSSYTFDALGNQTSFTDPLGNTSKATFDAATGKQLTDTDPLGHTNSWSYDFRQGRNNHLTQLQDPNGNVTQFTYFQGSGPLYAVDQPLGRHIGISIDPSKGTLFGLAPPGLSYSYVNDAQGRRISQTDALNHTISYGYDAAGNHNSRQWSRTLADGSVRTVRDSKVYDANGNVTSQTDAAGYVTSIQYNAAGKAELESDARGNKTHYVYDDSARLIEIDYADGSSEKTTYDEVGNVVQTTDRAGRVTQTQYDALNRPVLVVQPNGSSVSTSYDAAGRISSETDARGHAVTNAYDAAGKPVSISDALGRTTTYTYDSNGNRTSMTEPGGGKTMYTYDALNRLIQTTYPDGSTSSAAYDGAHLLSQTDRAGAVTSYGYDAKSQLTRVSQTLNGATLTTSYTYDEVGDKISQTDALGRVTKWAYDDLGHIMSRTLPNGETESFGYDGNGNLVSHVDFNGQTTRYVYDSGDRPAAKILPGGQQIQITYTGEGQVASVTDKTGTTAYQYDAQDHLTLVQGPSGTLAYAYDANGNRTQLTSPRGTTSYQYDEIDRLVAVNSPDGKQTRYSYDAAGNRATVAYPNNVLATYAYDSNHRVTGITYARTSDGVVLARYVYTLAANGQRTQVQEYQGSVLQRQLNYTYDNLRRLTQESLQSQVNGALQATRSTAWSYDSVGNRLSRTITTPSVGSNPATTAATSYTYDADDRLLTETTQVNGAQSQAIAYAYDANGNTLSATATANGTTTVTLYAYDAGNQLTQVSQGPTAQSASLIASFVYDAQGNRVQSNGRNPASYLIDDNQAYPQVIEETGTGGASALYVWGDGDLISQNASSSTSYFHGDALSSTRLLTDPTGNVTDTYSYLAFGAIDIQNGTTVNHHLFAGEYLDPSIGLYDLRARWMNPDSGRFLVRDTFQGREAAPASLHQYMYANQDPVDNTDPSGRESLQEEVTVEDVLGDLAVQEVQSLAEDEIFKAFDKVFVGDGLLGSPISIANPGGAAMVAIFANMCRAGKKYCFLRDVPTLVTGLPLIGHAAHTEAAELGLGNTESGGSSPVPFVLQRHKPRRAVSRLYSRWPCQAGAIIKGLLACDEYPFATSYQGGTDNWVKDRVSLQLLPRWESRAQGTMLSSFYRKADVSPGLGPSSLFLSVGVLWLPSFFVDRRGVWHRLP